MPSTLKPAPSKLSQVWEPMKPVAPVNRMRGAVIAASPGPSSR